MLTLFTDMENLTVTSALGGIRTHNPQLRRLALSPLSYEGFIQLYYVLARRANHPPDGILNCLRV